MQDLMGNVMDAHEVGKMELWEHECDIYSLTRTRTLKGVWFGLTVCIHCVPITLKWLRASNRNICNTWTRFGANGLLLNGMSNTKVGIMC